MVAHRSHSLMRQCLEAPGILTTCAGNSPEKSGITGEAEIHPDVYRYLLVEGLPVSCR